MPGLRNYICPRCDYQTIRKNDIRRHFYELKMPCYSSKKSVVLTDELKLAVLNHQPIISLESINNENVQVDVSHSKLISDKSQIISQSIDMIPPQINSLIDSNYQNNRPVINIQNINNNGMIVNNTQINQQLNNFYLIRNLVSQNDPITNLNSILNYTGDTLEDFDTTVEAKYLKQIGLLKVDKAKYLHTLTSNGLFNCINEVTRISKPNQFNFIYDKNLIRIYQDGEWEEYIEAIGVNKIIEILQYNYFNDYELYLLRKIHQPLCNSKILSIEHLEIYYKFLGTFDILPHVIDFTDQYITGYQIKENDDNSIEKYATEKYYQLKKKLKCSDIRATKNTVIKLIKTNSTRNVNDINLALLEILQVDTTYKEAVVNKYTKSNLLK